VKVTSLSMATITYAGGRPGHDFSAHFSDLALKEDESTPKCASCFADGVVDDDKLSAGLFTQKPAVGSKQFGSNSFDLKTCL